MESKIHESHIYVNGPMDPKITHPLGSLSHIFPLRKHPHHVALPRQTGSSELYVVLDPNGDWLKREREGGNILEGSFHFERQRGVWPMGGHPFMQQSNQYNSELIMTFA